jgi:segregation and condensation protein A
MAHPVLLENTFQGPMDLLLYLVRRDEIDIHDIPIAHLTREYRKELERRTDIPVDQASEFLAMASMLVEIKSRMLLPPAETPEGEEEEALIDPRQGLVQALLEYKRFKEAAAELGTMAERQALRFQRIAPSFFSPEAEPGAIENANAFDLLAAFQKMVRTMLTREAQEIVSDEVPTEVRIAQILEAVRTAGQTRFSRLLSSRPTKGEMVGFFIALLETIRLRHVWARQTADFSDIRIDLRRPEDRAPPADGLRERRDAPGGARWPPAPFLPLRRARAPGEPIPPPRRRSALFPLAAARPAAARRPTPAPRRFPPAALRSR